MSPELPALVAALCSGLAVWTSVASDRPVRRLRELQQAGQLAGAPPRTRQAGPLPSTPSDADLTRAGPPRLARALRVRRWMIGLVQRGRPPRAQRTSGVGRTRVPGLAGPGIGPPDGDASTGSASRRTAFGAAAGGIGVGVLVGGVLGVLTGLLVGVILRQWLAGLSTRAERERRRRLAADLPVGADLIAACLLAGAAMDDALEAVSDALGGPLADILRGTAAALRLGSDPVQCWRDLEGEPELRPLGRALARAAETGAPVAVAVLRLADERRREQRWAAEATARAVGVRAVAPLGLCFLPAFVLLALVPVVAGIAGAVLPTLQ